MSWGDEWHLPDEWRLRPDVPTVRRRAEAKRLLGRLGEELDKLQRLLQSEVTVETVDGGAEVELTFAKERALDVLRVLDPCSFVFQLDAERLAQEIEPPWDENASRYRVVMALSFGTADEPGRIAIESGEGDNRSVWAVAHAIFVAVGQGIGAQPVDLDPAEAMGWDPSAILRAPKP